MKKVIIDCDVGVDDAFALILAFHSPELEVKAVAGVNGNVPLSRVFENIQKILSLIHPPHKPLIAKGADHPLKGNPVYAHSVHGKDGLGGSKIELKKGEEWWEYFSRPADELITTLARQYPNELTLIATGPLTNLAFALQKDPAGMKKLKEISIMGGAVRVKGNITPYAEFNVFSDPLAAQKVFESGLPITLVPLDVTHQVFLTPLLIEERLKPIHNPFSQFVIEAIGYDIIAHRFLRSSDLIYLHDPLAVGVVIDPTLVRTEPLSLDVNIQEGYHYGHMTEVSGRSKIDVCLEVDAERFLDLFLSRLR
jgi:inosine-uridine nucleoside N-ribohydrolase